MESVKYSAAELSGWVSRPWKHSNRNFPILGISHDTRTLKPGEVYIAIKGENHDGHDFVQQAVEKGAVGLIVEKEVAGFADIPQLIVPDTLAALHELASGIRLRWKGLVIGITGSAGKTTVKEMIAAVLAQKGTVAKTPGNWNNEIGLPLSMLAADRNADFFVFELGMSHPGEIDRLASLLKPDWAVLTDIGKAHIEFFQGLEKIAEEKSALTAHADHVLLDETSEWFELFKSRCRGEVVVFGQESFGFELPQPGEFMICNARRAVALGRELGLSDAQIQAGLNAFEPAAMRWERLLHHGIVLINDAYNANPLSMRAALNAFADMPCEGRRFAVLGAMLELGNQAEEEHRSLGEFVDTLGLDGVVTIGEAGAWIHCHGIVGVSKEAAVKVLRDQLRSGDAVLFKASRGERLETALDELTAKL